MQENSMRKFHESYIMQRLNYILIDMLNTSYCIFTISKRNMTWCWNINNWESIIYKLTELMKLWSLIHSTVEAIVYMIYHDMFMIMITWIQHNMNCSYWTAWCCLKIINNLKKFCYFRTTKIFENSNNSHLQENSMKKFHESYIMQKLSYVLIDMLNTSYCIFMIPKKNMTWC